MIKIFKFGIILFFQSRIIRQIFLHIQIKFRPADAIVPINIRLLSSFELHNRIANGSQGKINNK